MNFVSSLACVIGAIMLAGIGLLNLANAQEPLALQSPPGAPPTLAIQATTSEATAVCENQIEENDETSAARQIAECTEIIQSQAPMPGKLAAAYYIRGNAFLSKGRYDQAVQDFSQAIRLAPKISLPYINRGAAYQQQGQLDLAMQDLTQGIDLDPTVAVAFFARGTLHLAMRHHDQAIADFDNGIKLNPTDSRAFIYRGTAFRESAQYDRASADFDQALRLNPELASAYSNRCWLRAFVQLNLAAALIDCDEALRLQPGVENVEAMRSFVKGKIEVLTRAIADFTAALQIEARDANALYGRGVARLRTGDKGGLADLEAAKSLKANIGEAYAKLYGVNE